MHLKKEFLLGILIFLSGTVAGVVLFKSSVFQSLTTVREKNMSMKMDSLRVLLLTERANAGLINDRLKIANNDFDSDGEKKEIEAKVYMMESKILGRARDYSDLKIVIENIVMSSPNFRKIPAIIPLKPGTFKRLSSGYGWRMHPVIGSEKLHTGIDISALAGTVVYAPADGTVLRADPYWTKSGYGNRIIIEHNFGFQTLYGHLSSFLVKVGDKVSVGQPIGLVGSTGISTGPHLHYEIIKNGNKINPYEFTLITAKKLKMKTY